MKLQQTLWRHPMKKDSLFQTELKKTYHLLIIWRFLHKSFYHLFESTNLDRMPNQAKQVKHFITDLWVTSIQQNKTIISTIMFNDCANWLILVFTHFNVLLLSLSSELGCFFFSKTKAFFWWWRSGRTLWPFVTSKVFIQPTYWAFSPSFIIEGH